MLELPSPGPPPWRTVPTMAEAWRSVAELDLLVRCFEQALARFALAHGDASSGGAQASGADDDWLQAYA